MAASNSSLEGKKVKLAYHKPSDGEALTPFLGIMRD